MQMNNVPPPHIYSTKWPFVSLMQTDSDHVEKRQSNPLTQTFLRIVMCDMEFLFSYFVLQFQPF